MPQKPQYVQGWFYSDPRGPHPEHPIVIPPGSGSGPVDPGYGYPEKPVDPGYGIPEYPPHVEHPIVIPPLTGVWPPPGQPSHPIVIPPPDGPVYIEGTPEKPIASAPGTLTPTLPSDVGLPQSKVALLVKVVGVPGERWLTFDNSPKVTPQR